MRLAASARKLDGRCAPVGAGAALCRTTEIAAGIEKRLSFEAIDLYGKAIEMNGRIGARPFAAQSRLGLAQALSARAASGDGAEARALAVTAAGEFRRIGMPGHLRTADELIARIDSAARGARDHTPLRGWPRRQRTVEP